MIQNISLAVYHKELIDHIGSSTLKQLKTSPLWMRYAQQHPDDNRISLEAELKGSVYHSMLASLTNKGDMSDFENEYVVFDPPINDRTGKPFGYDTKAFTEAYESFQVANPDKNICSKTEIDLSKAMIEMLTKGNSHLSKDINFLIKNGIAEQSHLVEHENLKFKFRPDLETKKKIIDWKTIGYEGPKTENFSRQIVKLGYHISAAFYQFFDFIENGVWRNFYWVVQEKEPPFDFNIISAENWAFEIYSIEKKDYIVIPEDVEKYVIESKQQIAIPHAGAIQFLELLEEYIYCEQNDYWPGYSVFTEPDWLKHRIAIAPVPSYERLTKFYN